MWVRKGRSSAFREAAGLLSVAAFLGGPLIAQNGESTPDDQPLIHVVQAGDTLGSLARTYYGDASQWRRLQERNEHLGDPRHLKPGALVVVLEASERQAEIETIRKDLTRFGVSYLERKLDEVDAVLEETMSVADPKHAVQGEVLQQESLRLRGELAEIADRLSPAALEELEARVRTLKYRCVRLWAELWEVRGEHEKMTIPATPRSKGTLSPDATAEFEELATDVERLEKQISALMARLEVLEKPVATPRRFAAAALVLPAEVEKGVSIEKGEPPARTQEEVLDMELRRTLDGLEAGRVAYKPAHEMTQGIPEEVRVRVTSQPGADVESELGEGLVVAQEIRTSCIMTATLTGHERGFVIEERSSREQPLDSPYSEWLWSVTPLEAGDLMLQLRVTARIRISNGEVVAKDVLVEQVPTTVHPNPGWVASRFWEEHWRWLVGSPLFVALVMWLATRGWKSMRQYRNRRRRAGFG